MNKPGPHKEKTLIHQALSYVVQVSAVAHLFLTLQNRDVSPLLDHTYLQLNHLVLQWTKILAISEHPRLQTPEYHLDVRIWSEGTIHHTNEECLLFETGRMNSIVLQTTHPDLNLVLSLLFFKRRHLQEFIIFEQAINF